MKKVLILSILLAIGFVYFQLKPNVKIIKAKIDGTVGVDCDFSGNRAIQDAIESINDASENNRYEILIYPGVYKATSIEDFDSEGSGGGYYSFIRGKDFVSIRGINRDSTIIKGELPDDLGHDFLYAAYQTLLWNADEANIEGLTITAKNLRYPIHIDGGQLGMANAHLRINNTKIIHFGNSNDAKNWPAPHPLGLGMSDGQILIVENSILQSPTRALAMHTNKDFKIKSQLVYKNCEFIAQGAEKDLATMESLGSKKQDDIYIVNCKWDEGYVILAHDWPYLSTGIENQSYKHCDLKIHGYGNNKFLWESNFRGYALKIVSKSNSGTVRFNIDSDAFQDVISNEQSKYKTILYNGEVSEKGYSFRDGKNEIKGYAIGHLDVGDEVTFDKKFIKSLGKRLGDCSKEIKILGVVIDGKPYNIVFDKNYVGEGLNNADKPSDISNIQVLEEINNVIGDVAEASLWAVGNDYYPEFSDCLDTVRASENILNGMIVFKEKSGKIRRATEDDKEIYGVALDDIIENGNGRVLFKGYLLADKNKRFRILTDVDSNIEKGESIGVSHTPGIASKNAIKKLFVAKDNNVINIK